MGTVRTTDSLGFVLDDLRGFLGWFDPDACHVARLDSLPAFRCYCRGESQLVQPFPFQKVVGVFCYSLFSP